MGDRERNMVILMFVQIKFCKQLAIGLTLINVTNLIRKKGILDLCSNIKFKRNILVAALFFNLMFIFMRHGAVLYILVISTVILDCKYIDC